MAVTPQRQHPVEHPHGGVAASGSRGSFRGDGYRTLKALNIRALPL